MVGVPGRSSRVSTRRATCGLPVEVSTGPTIAATPGALSQYHGDFLAGFHVPDVSAELEEWVERTRTRLRRHAASAAWAAAGAATQGDSAVDLGRRACELEPDQEGGWRRLMTLQERLGDRAGALRTYDELVARLRREFDADPSAETRALAARLRATHSADAAGPPSMPEAPPDTSARATEPKPIVAAGSPRRARRLLAVTGVGSLLLVAAAVSLRLSAEHSEEPSLITSGVLSPRDRLLIADFTDTRGDTALAVAITEAFRVDLSQSPNVRVMTPRQVGGALERLERSADLVVNDSLAREIALREAVKAFVVGRVSDIAGRWTLTVELVGAESGEVLTAVRESLRELHALPPLAQEMTASLPALRKYTEGNRFAYTGEHTRALQLFQQAVALDSTFSSAHLALAHIYDGLAESGRSADAFKHALAHLDRLPYRDRQFLLANRAAGREEWDAAIEAYTRYLERYPGDIPALNNFALVYRDARRLAPAETLWARAVALDSTIPVLYYGLHTVQLLEGQFDESRRALDLIGRRFPDNPVLFGAEVQDAATQHDWEGAERRAEASIAARQSDTLGLVDPFEQMAAIVMTEGRLAEAERYWRTQLKLSALSESWGRRLFGARQLGYLQLRYRRAPVAAIAIVDSVLAQHPLDSTLPGDRPYYELARFYAEAGEVPRARRLVAEAQANDSLLDLPHRSERLWTAGVIALADGHAADAEVALRETADEHVCAICALPDLARAYEARGNAAMAISAYERYITTPWYWRYEVDASELGFALKRLGELYEVRGDEERARQVRTRLLALWRRADAELQPTLADIRTRVALPRR
jgi:tetratricopeptide (TPR) repeat protein